MRRTYQTDLSDTEWSYIEPHVRALPKTSGCSQFHALREILDPSSTFVPGTRLNELVWEDLCEVLIYPEHVEHALCRAHGGEWLRQGFPVACGLRDLKVYSLPSTVSRRATGT